MWLSLLAHFPGWSSSHRECPRKVQLKSSWTQNGQRLLVLFLCVCFKDVFIRLSWTLKNDLASLTSSVYRTSYNASLHQLDGGPFMTCNEFGTPSLSQWINFTCHQNTVATINSLLLLLICIAMVFMINPVTLGVIFNEAVLNAKFLLHLSTLYCQLSNDRLVQLLAVDRSVIPVVFTFVFDVLKT